MAYLPQFITFHTVATLQHKWDPSELLSSSTGITSAWPAVPVKATTTKQSCGICWLINILGHFEWKGTHLPHLTEKNALKFTARIRKCYEVFACNLSDRYHSYNIHDTPNRFLCKFQKSCTQPMGKSLLNESTCMFDFQSNSFQNSKTRHKHQQ